MALVVSNTLSCSIEWLNHVLAFTLAVKFDVEHGSSTVPNAQLLRDGGRAVVVGWAAGLRDERFSDDRSGALKHSATQTAALFPSAASAASFLAASRANWSKCAQTSVVATDSTGFRVSGTSRSTWDIEQLK
jgi:hypothetical protein